MERLHPGVYIEEIPSGVRPIEGVSTSTACFIGKAESGPVGKAVLITNLQEFQKKFGGFLDDSYLAHSVMQFFNNGGKKCYIIRVATSDASAAKIGIKDRKGKDSSGTDLSAKTLTISAASPGAWGNKLDIVVKDGRDDPDNEFNLEVWKDRSDQQPAMPSQLLETFENLSINPNAVNFVGKIINSKSEFITVEVDLGNLDNLKQSELAKGVSLSGTLPVGDGAIPLKLAPGLASAVPGSVGLAGKLAGGSFLTVTLPADQRRFAISIDGDGPHEVIVPANEQTGQGIAEAIQEIVRTIVPQDPAKKAAFDGFTCEYYPSYLLLTSGSVGDGSSVFVEIIGDGSHRLLLNAEDGADKSQVGKLRSGFNPSINPPAGQRQFWLSLDGSELYRIAVPPTATTGKDIADAIQMIVQKLTVPAEKRQAFEKFTCSYHESAGLGDSPYYLLTSGTSQTGSGPTVNVTKDIPQFIKLGAGDHKFFIEVNGDGPHLVTLEGPIENGGKIATQIADVVHNSIQPKRKSNVAAFKDFQCTYQNDATAGSPCLRLTSGTAGLGSRVRVTDAVENNVAGLLKLGVTNKGKEIAGEAIARPAVSKTPQQFPGDTEYHLGDAVGTGNVVDGSVKSGDDGGTPGDKEYQEILTAGNSPLDTVRDVNLICVPGNSSKAVVDAGTNYCTQRMDCFFIGDVNLTDDTIVDAKVFLDGLTVKSSYGAIYYPWLNMVDPSGRSLVPIAVPPSGFVAGMYARIDGKRGVWKAPAGTEANIGGAVGLVAETTDTQQDFLNPIGVNVIRSFPASGIVIWGTRTLATRSDPEYRYIPVRRTAIFLEQSIYNGIQWAVFEPNDEDLWASLRMNIGAFMMLQFRAGAFQGKTPNDAFFVKCDSQTTTQADIDAGIVNILVGFAPLKPAEFVVLKLSQKAGQSAA